MTQKTSMLDNLHNGDMLQSILFGTFVPPKEVAVRPHRIGLTSVLHRYKEPKKAVRSLQGKKTDGLNLSEKLVLATLKKQKAHASSCDIAPLVKMTRNHCGILLAALFKHDLVTRYKIKHGKTRMYVYAAKDKDAS